MTYMEQIVLRLTQVRKARGITQMQIAEATGIGKSGVAKTEGGIRRLSINEAHDWCNAVGLRLSDLIAVLEDGKPLDTVPKTVEFEGHTYVLEEQA